MIYVYIGIAYLIIGCIKDRIELKGLIEKDGAWIAAFAFLLVILAWPIFAMKDLIKLFFGDKKCDS